METRSPDGAAQISLRNLRKLDCVRNPGFVASGETIPHYAALHAGYVAGTLATTPVAA
jgi:hypothetical protein